MSWIGHAEEMRREGRLVRRVCEGARDAVHVRSRLERASAGCRRRHQRLEICIFAPLGHHNNRSGEPRHADRLDTSGLCRHRGLQIGTETARANQAQLTRRLVAGYPRLFLAKQRR